MSFRPDCGSCVYLTLVLRRPSACREHLGTAFWSTPGETLAGRSQRWRPPTLSDDEPPDAGEVPPRFTAAEYYRLLALRERVRRRRRLGLDEGDRATPGERADREAG